jgi:hypothetical protein
MAGRKTKLTPDTQAAIVAAIQAGAFATAAAQAAGIHPGTYYDWLKAGAAGRQPYRDFRDMVLAAHAHARTDAERRVFDENPLAWLRAAARPDWQERRKHELSDPDGQPVSFTLRIDRGDTRAADRL